MFSSGPNYTKLKTNLRLAINRLKLLEKKKIELTQKSRKEIADYIAMGKVDRARIRVEHIIREDYIVEGMEMLEMYCDLLLARFGLLQQMKNVDPGLLEAIAGVVWAGPRLVADVPEMKPVCDQLAMKYGKEFVEKCRGSSESNGVNEKFQLRLGVSAPPKILVEQYLIEISKNYNVPFEPDRKVMKEAEAAENLLVNFDDDSTNNLGGGGGSGTVDPPGFRGFPQPPALPTSSDFHPFNYPSTPQQGGVGGFVMPSPSGSAPAKPFVPPAAFSYNIPADEMVGKPRNFPLHYEAPPPSYNHATANDPPQSMDENKSVDENKQNNEKPKPTPRGKLSPSDRKPQNTDLFPELPSVPDDMPDLPPDAHVSNTSSSMDDIDFDDLNRRFQNLKK